MNVIESHRKMKDYINKIQEEMWENKVKDYIEHLWWRLKDYKYIISCYFFPRQRWVQKYLGRTYRDKDTLIVDFIFGCIIEFVESEKCFDVIVWQDSPQNIENKKRLIEIYGYAKFGRKSLEEQLFLSYPEDKFDYKNIKNKDYEIRYKEVNRIEAEIKTKNDEYLSWIVENRQILWT